MKPPGYLEVTLWGDLRVSKDVFVLGTTHHYRSLRTSFERLSCHALPFVKRGSDLLLSVLVSRLLVRAFALVLA